MSTSKKYLTVGIIILILLIVGGFFIFNYFKSKEENKPIEYTPSGNITQTVEDPEVTTNSQIEDEVNPEVNNADLSDTLSPTKEMQTVIDQNAGSLNNSEVIDEVTPSYPSNVIPLYKAKTAADSSDIITDNGRPGWLVNYGSDATVTDIKTFYDNLMKSTTGYNTEQSGDTYTIAGTVDNCYVQVSISPNNPDQTGLDDQSDVSIFIERD